MQYEKSGVSFKPSAIKEWKNICNQKIGAEKHCIERAYDRLMGSVVTLKTAQGKKNKIKTFFDEAEYYFPQLEEENVEYIESLKKQALAEYPDDEQTGVRRKFCPKCGNSVNTTDVFCSSCGTKL